MEMLRILEAFRITFDKNKSLANLAESMLIG